MGFTISKAEADYNNEDYSQRIDIEITDLSGATGYAGLAAWGWAMVDIDKESETGYEKTLSTKGTRHLKNIIIRISMAALRCWYLADLWSL